MRRILDEAVILLGLWLVLGTIPVQGQEARPYRWEGEATLRGHCKSPSVEELRRLAEEHGKTLTGEPAGVEVVGTSTGAEQNASLGQLCTVVSSWCPDDKVLTIKYRKPVLLWHVERTVQALETTPWFASANAKGRYTKAETIARFALPNCQGWPVESSNFGMPNPVPIPFSDCQPVTCPGGTYRPGTVIQYTGASLIAAGVEMVFGYVGPNLWGPGGELQWFVPDFESQKIVPLPPEEWKGD